MKTILLFIISVFFSQIMLGQVGTNSPWTWMKGDDTYNEIQYFTFFPMPPVGVEHPTARPDTRTSAATFTDNEGNLWLFGGYSDVFSPQGFYYNDLWKFNPLTNNWTFMKGDGGYTTPILIPPVYGTMGVPHLLNKPGSRSAAISWSDNNGNLWLFGGYGYGDLGSFGSLNDLWKYNISTNMWTWMKGSSQANSPGVYGSAGVAHPANVPPPRVGSVSWRYDDGTLWLFGGADYTLGIYNDIWKYDPATNNWTWLKGGLNTLGVHGTQGVPHAANIPHPRYFSSGWAETGGSLWIFGGHESLSFPEYRNDVWRFDPVTSMWTWEKGLIDIATAATYGTPGTEAPANNPASKFGMMTATDLSGNFWLFGGIDAVTTLSNELWKFNPGTKQWAFMKGEGNVAGIYGTMGVPSIINRPGSRNNGAMWTGNDGKFWIFGGYGNDKNNNLGSLSDMWMINSLSLLPDRNITLRGSYQNGRNILEWNINEVSDVRNFILERSTDASSFEPVLTVQAFQPRTNYDKEDIPPVKKRYFYRIKVQYSNSYYYSNIIAITPTRKPMDVYPNPAINFVNIRTETGSQPLRYMVYNMVGKEMINVKIPGNTDHIPVNISSWPAGMYRVKICYDHDEEWGSFVK